MKTHAPSGAFARLFAACILLLAFVDAALAGMAADGTLDSLKAKHGLAPGRPAVMSKGVPSE